MDEISKMNLHYGVLKFTPFKRQLRRYQSHCLSQFVVHRNARNHGRKAFYGIVADKLGFLLTPYAGARRDTQDVIHMESMMNRIKFLDEHYPNRAKDGSEGHMLGEYWIMRRKVSDKG